MPRIADYKAFWFVQTPGSQAEEYARELAVGRAENQVRADGQRFIDGERERLSGRAEAVSQSSADIQAAARAITKACGSRIVNVEEVADQLDELERQARKDREDIARIDEHQTTNEDREPLAVGEALYEKYTVLVHPLDVEAHSGALPPFRTASEQSSPASNTGLPGRNGVRASKARGRLRT